jgi:hypothetical protein
VDSYTKEELEEAQKAFSSLISKCEKVQEKLTGGTSQHTLIIRRLRAFYMAQSMIEQALGEETHG